MTAKSPRLVPSLYEKPVRVAPGGISSLWGSVKPRAPSDWMYTAEIREEHKLAQRVASARGCWKRERTLLATRNLNSEVQRPVSTSEDSGACGRASARQRTVRGRRAAEHENVVCCCEGKELDGRAATERDDGVWADDLGLG